MPAFSFLIWFSIHTWGLFDILTSSLNIIFMSLVLFFYWEFASCVSPFELFYAVRKQRQPRFCFLYSRFYSAWFLMNICFLLTSFFSFLPSSFFFFITSYRGWDDGSVVRSTGCTTMRTRSWHAHLTNQESHPCLWPQFRVDGITGGRLEHAGFQPFQGKISSRFRGSSRLKGIGGLYMHMHT